MHAGKLMMLTMELGFGYRMICRESSVLLVWALSYGHWQAADAVYLMMQCVMCVMKGQQVGSCACPNPTMKIHA